MIKIEEIRISEFRGIRELTLTLGGKSFAVWGPNGSGKSGVVDAIDFALTGNIARLTGTGSGGLTLAKHGPHVHRRDDPNAATVALRVRDVASGETAVLTRTVKSAKTYMLEPDSARLRASVDRAAQHPEIILSRREIIRYIVSEPGKRAQEVQALLKLEQLGSIRSVLRNVQTRTETALAAAESQVAATDEALRRHLDVPKLATAEVLTIINTHRSTLGLSHLTQINDGTDLSSGIDEDSALSSFNKPSAARDVSALRLSVDNPADLASALERLKESLATLNADPEILDALRTRELVSAGLDLLDDASCPLCDTQWSDAAALQAHLAMKLNRSNDAATLQAQLRHHAESVSVEVAALRSLVTTAASIASQLGVPEVRDLLTSWTDELLVFANALGSTSGIREQGGRINSGEVGVPEGLGSAVSSLLAKVQAHPDQTATSNARTYLIIAQERWRAFRQARAERQRRSAARTVAGTIYKAYCEEQDGALTALYHTVEASFSDFYCQLNSDDEAAFKAQLETSAGKLDLSVDFHGLGMFPPAAYHSEGHQDGMGVCLYLALLRQILGSDFQLAVLDDVVMSIDTSHRRQFCNLLKKHFPDVQFIITTHDAVWARQMQSSGLISRAAQVRFLHWTVDAGPALEHGKDFWDHIDADLEKDDVPAAAARLRRNLEASLADLADSVHGQIAYRSDGNYELNDLVSAVKGKYRKLLNQAAKAANSYNNSIAKAQVEALQARRAQAVLDQEGEQWAINPAVHFNDWANFSKSDFLPVVEAWKQFLSLFTCDNPDCESWISTTGSAGNETAIRCDCGALNISLVSK
ncbi:MAG TPA: AAA family ATPase [Ilumatobacter sp.]|nr:AAA family ATPase [Ilumatobacter sp.]